MHPPGPGEEPRGAVLRLCKNFSRSNSKASQVQLSDALRQRSKHLLRALALQFSQRVEVSRCSSRTSKTLSSSGHFPRLHFPASRHCSLIDCPFVALSLRDGSGDGGHCFVAQRFPITLSEQTKSPTQILFAHPSIRRNNHTGNRQKSLHARSSMT